MKKIGTFLLVITMSGAASAGVAGLTSHSRANCGNNESIDWDATQYHYLCSISDHFHGGKIVHERNTGWANTWRSAAVDWFEAAPGAGWVVMGIHWEIINRVPYNIANETVTDCSIYDGWWGIKNNKIEKQDVPSNILKPISLTDEDIEKLKSVPRGISIMPFKDTVIPNELKSMMLDQIRAKNSSNYKGYEDSDSPNAKMLLRIGQEGKKEIVDNNDPSDTHLKSNISYLTLAFPYSGISFMEKNNVIGYGVTGSWINENGHKGWTGTVEYFSDKNLGVCRYNISNAILAKAAVQLSQEEVKYSINNKPTIENIQGSYNSGFMYRIDWFDSSYFSSIECANMHFDKDILAKMIALANKIDKQ